MLAWLDQANSGSVQGAADRLVSAAKEIRKIAEDLKVRPQYVEWKGAGADAFRTWSADLANATLRLGDYSEDASKWLGQASDAIATAQASIPRTQSGAQANLDAALAAHNDPDASAVARKSAETLLAAKEDNRHEAAAQMRKLAQSYSLSATQLDGLERPAFPPPPQAIVPDDKSGRGQEASIGGPGGGNTARTTPIAAAGAAHGQNAASGGPVVSPSQHMAVVPGSPSSPATVMPAPSTVHLGIDAIARLPDAPSDVRVTSPNVSGGGRPDSSLPLVGTASPPFDGGPVPSVGVGGAGRAIGAVRPIVAGPGAQPFGSMPVDPLARGNGITGGRQVPQTPGRSAGGLPRGTVIGGEGSHGGAPMGGGAGVGSTSVGTGRGQRGIPGGRRLAAEPGGVVGGPGAQQPGRTSARPFTPGGSGLVRGMPPEGARGPGQAGRGAHPVVPRGSRTGGRRNGGGERPDYLIEDEETWQQNDRPIVPPVID